MKHLPYYLSIFFAGLLLPISDLEVDGFTKLGSNAPSIKMKSISGTSASAEGSSSLLTHGLDVSKIVSVQVNIRTGAEPNDYRYYLAGSTSVGNQFEVSWKGQYIRVTNHETNSENILSKPTFVIVTYKA